MINYNDWPAPNQKLIACYHNFPIMLKGHNVVGVQVWALSHELLDFLGTPLHLSVAHGMTDWGEYIQNPVCLTWVSKGSALGAKAPVTLYNRVGPNSSGPLSPWWSWGFGWVYHHENKVLSNPRTKCSAKFNKGDWPAFLNFKSHQVCGSGFQFLHLRHRDKFSHFI